VVEPEPGIEPEVSGGAADTWAGTVGSAERVFDADFGELFCCDEDPLDPLVVPAPLEPPDPDELGEGDGDEDGSSPLSRLPTPLVTPPISPPDDDEDDDEDFGEGDAVGSRPLTMPPISPGEEDVGDGVGDVLACAAEPDRSGLTPVITTVPEADMITSGSASATLFLPKTRVVAAEARPGLRGRLRLAISANPLSPDERSPRPMLRRRLRCPVIPMLSESDESLQKS
jgi:hypothetical protein